MKAFGSADGMTRGWDVLHHAVAEAERFVRHVNNLAGGAELFVPHWLDHFGSIKEGSETHFVSEPYMIYPPRERDLAVPHHLARSTNCRLLVVPDSEWNPPGTIRLLFKRNEDEE